jgi:hypothetical protein
MLRNVSGHDEGQSNQTPHALPAVTARSSSEFIVVVEGKGASAVAGWVWFRFPTLAAIVHAIDGRSEGGDYEYY